MNALLAPALLLLTVVLSLLAGVFASYLMVRVILRAFGSRAAQPALLTRAQAAGGD